MYLVPGGVSGPGGVWPGGACLVPGGGCLAWGVSGLGGGGVWSWGGGMSGPRGVPGQVLPPVNRMTDRCKNITLAKTSFRPVTKFIMSSLALALGTFM